MSDDILVLTMYAPYGDLWLSGIKEFETRPRGVRCALPTKLFIHNALKPMSPQYKQLATKYLGEEYKPAYGKIIGSCNLTHTFKMTEEIISQRSPQELELGNWQVGRVAWAAENRIYLPKPIDAVGYQAAPWKAKSDLQTILRNFGVQQKA